MWNGFGKRVNYIAIVSTCWGVLLTSVAFVSLIWSPDPAGDDDGELEQITLQLVCQASILALGCVQTIFSAVLLLTRQSTKESWTTIWVCAHMVVFLGLIFFYGLQTIYPTVSSSSSNSSFFTNFSTLDATLLFDFFFLVTFFLSILCERPPKYSTAETPPPAAVVINPTLAGIASLGSPSTLSGAKVQHPNVLLNPNFLGKTKHDYYYYVDESGKKPTL